MNFLTNVDATESGKEDATMMNDDVTTADSPHASTVLTIAHAVMNSAPVASLSKTLENCN